MKRPVADDSFYYQQVMRVMRIAATLLPIAVVPIGLLERMGLIDNTYYQSDAWYFVTSALLVGIAIAQYFLIKYRPTPENYLIMAVAYHAVGITYLLTVTGFVSPVLVCWIAMMIAVDTYFGIIGLLLSSLALVLTASMSLVLFGDNPVQVITTFAYAAAIIGVGLTVSRVRTVTDKERVALIRSREDENFQRERLLALVNSMGDAVIATDEDGVVKVYNAATLNLLDTNVDINGKKIDRVLHLYDESGKRTYALEQAHSKRAVFSRTDLLHRFKDGEQINLYINFSPIQLSYQGTGDKGFIFILRDITKEKSLEEERDEFISVVSHELRTPVAIVEGNISNVRVLQDRGADKAVLVRALDDAHDQIMYLAKMINDLSTLSRAERGLDSAREDINVGDFLTEMFKNYTDAAQKKNLHLNLDMQPRLPQVNTSRLYLEEIMQNLITNALKYTKTGGVTIMGHRTKDGVYFAVQDTGIGISKSDQHHIFEKFYRSEDYRTRETSGTGLGLYVTKKLADKMGIEIKFESRLNHGSTFSFTIPTKPDEQK